MSSARRTSIRVGQRLRNWDGTRGYVALNTQGKRVFGPGESFLVEWVGLDDTVEDSAYDTLADLEREGDHVRAWSDAMGAVGETRGESRDARHGLARSANRIVRDRLVEIEPVHLGKGEVCLGRR